MTFRSALLGAVLPALAFGLLATAADAASPRQFDLPARVTAGPAGVFYVADTFQHRIVKIQNGAAVVVAGTGVSGFSGDTGPATAAQISYPYGMAVDASGNLFFADEGNNRIRKIDASGTITTIAGDGLGGSTLLGAVLPDGDGGPATAAHLYHPYSLALQTDGSLLVADTFHNRLRKIDTAGNINAFYGNGTFAAMFLPVSVAIDPTTGDVYTAEFFGNLVRHIKADGTGVLGAITKNATATRKFGTPYDVTFDKSGMMYVADSNGNQVVAIDHANTWTTVAGTGIAGYSGDAGSATAAQVRAPFGVSIAANGDIAIADQGNGVVRKIHRGTIGTLSGPAAKPARPATLVSTPEGVPHFKHVWEIVLENTEASSVVGNPAMPYFNSLASQGVVLQNYFGTGHFSLDNYMSIASGLEPNPNTQLDCSVVTPGCSVRPFISNTGAPVADNIGSQLTAKNLSWKTYAESMPAACTYSPAAPTIYNAPFAERHVPFLFFHSIIDNAPYCAAHVVPYADATTGLTADLASAATTPAYSLIVPNSIDDAHDTVAGANRLTTADTWLANNLPAILNSPAYADHGVVLITFDEGGTSLGAPSANPGGGNIATILLSPLAKTGAVSTVPYNHYSFLRTIEDNFKLPLLNHAGDANVPAFGGDIWK